jgi:hypothetical protein
MALSSFSSALPLDVDHTRRCYFRTVASVFSRSRAANAILNRCSRWTHNRSILVSEGSERFSRLSREQGHIHIRCRRPARVARERTRAVQSVKSERTRVTRSAITRIRECWLSPRSPLGEGTDFSRPSLGTRSYSKFDEMRMQRRRERAILPSSFSLQFDAACCAKLHQLASTRNETN